ncbi:MAG: hypothetical protein AMJ54_13505 [Deltaproteobacteria bacterium SG8_13]|nr:MAG: hypothetical protein AMJ54_13505 [Deltaproteobacteria bacterium SG8_13]
MAASFIVRSDVWGTATGFPESLPEDVSIGVLIFILYPLVAANHFMESLIEKQQRIVRLPPHCSRTARARVFGRM